MAGALAVVVRSTLKSDFRRINPTTERIVLVDMAPRVLGSFSEGLSKAAKRRLEELGVEIRLGHSVDQIDADGVTVAGERIASKTVIWTKFCTPPGCSAASGDAVRRSTTASASPSTSSVNRFAPATPSCRFRSRRARSLAPPVAQRTNSSTAAENDSECSSTCSRNSFQDLKPYSRAMTNCASCNAIASWPSGAAALCVSHVPASRFAGTSGRIG